MEPTNWAPEHSDALRELSCQRHVLFGDREGDQFKVQHHLFAQRGARSRQADGACGRGAAGSRRMRAKPPTLPDSWRSSLDRAQDRPRFLGRRRCSREAKPNKLRCVEIEPRHLSLIDLEHGDCRYPYGGDEEGEAITFCGHPRRAGFELLHAAFSFEPRPDPAAGARGEHVLLRARRGGMNFS